MKTYLILLFSLIIQASCFAQPIALHPQNPHYFIYNNKPLVLITSAEHYGAVINTAIDYKTYLDVLHKNDFNLTRIFSGAYCEGTYYDFEPGKEYKWEENQNTLSVRPNKLLAPWARSDSPGYINGGNKFNLDKWDDDYFTRLKDFCRRAAEKNIIVEVVFFSANYGPVTWKNSPLNAINNINGIEKIAYNQFHLPTNKKLINYQLTMVKKMVEELNEFDNIYFELCNEPYWLKGIPETEASIKKQQFLPEIEAWQQMISATVKATEKRLPKKHLIAQNFANQYLKIENSDTNISILNFHYAYPPKAVTDNHHLNKPLAFDETADGLDAPNRRREAWAFILEGGAVYNNLDWSYAHDDITGMGRNAAGERQIGTLVWQQLQVLIKNINGFYFIKAQPLNSSFKKELPVGVNLYGLEIEGEDYMLYWVKDKIVGFEKWSISLPAGNFSIQWVDPLNGNIIEQQNVEHAEGVLNLNIPFFSDDITLRLKRIH